MKAMQGAQQSMKTKRADSVNQLRKRRGRPDGAHAVEDSTLATHESSIQKRTTKVMIRRSFHELNDAMGTLDYAGLIYHWPHTLGVL